MLKLRLIAFHEYTRHVLRKRFIWVLLSVPLMVALLVGIVYLAISMENDYRPIAYVDHSGMLANPVPAPPRSKPVEIRAYPAESEARKALDAGEIQAYYVLSADYLQSNHVDLVYIKSPKSNATSQFFDFMQMNWLAGQPPEVSQRLAAMSDNDFIVHTPDGRREFKADPTLGQMLPVLFGMAFLMLLGFSGGYLVQVVAEEKENRTMEIMATSASPNQLIGGKVLGLVGVVLTQVVAWAIFIAGAVFLGGKLFNSPFIQDARMDGQTVLILLAVFVPGFIMYAAFMTAMGATVAEAQEAQQVTGLFILPNAVPLWITAMIIENPNSPIAIAMTLFPLTSPVTMSLRVAFSTVPLWQTITAVALLVLSAWGAVWLAGRAFRLGMLRYGKRVDLRELFGKAKPRPAAGGSHV
jgi:ABC-2 type transport system permease protein